MREVWILSGSRTPIGSFLGGLSQFSATELGAFSISSALTRSSVAAEDIEEVYMGCVLTSGLGQAPARQAALGGGLPKQVPCTTVGKVCGSGLKAVMMAAQAIRSGEINVAVAGGMESMSNTPFLVPHMRTGHKMGHTEMKDAMVHDGLWDVYNNFHMGSAAELCASEKHITREEQDRYAKQSYERAQKATQAGWFDPEIAPVVWHDKKGDPQSVKADEDVFKAKFEKFATLKPVFKKDGSVTAANASNLNDGAAALVLADAEWARNKGLKPMAIIKGMSQSAREPEWFTLAPVDAIEKLHQKLDWSSQSVDFYEVNEAFSLVSLAAANALNISEEKMNVHGGAVALGHPIGASGARILVTLLYALKQYEKKRGIASLCIGGGEAVALGVECQ